MYNKITTILLITFSIQAQSSCIDSYKFSANFLSKDYKKSLTKMKRVKGKKHHTITLGGIESARKIAYNSEFIKKLNLPSFNKWENMTSNMSKSSFFNKRIGKKVKLENGNYAEVRLDYSPGDGLHYNLNYRIKDHPNPQLKGEYKLAIKINCKNKICTEKEALKMHQSIFKD